MVLMSDWLEVGSVALSATSIAVTIFIFYSHINKSLQLILSKKASYLTREQAIRLLDFYLYSVKKDLLHLIDTFFRSEFPECSRENNTDRVYNFVYRITDDTIKTNRSQLSFFELKNGQKMDDFLNSKSPIDDDPGLIIDAKKKVYSLFIDAVANKISEKIAWEGAMKELDDANRLARKIIKTQIDSLYNDLRLLD
ncbi:hypothetical protein [Candidatus Magnetominusculus dajiuhuensis]|uniref:hypothetical protein n=1 Tax=Candidatus Magnetominusculus dajiuhuensis TaxID=3137712 RepID=UPI003B42ED8A